jgi:glycosyltransferase involved in cell wall biosynthesis
MKDMDLLVATSYPAQGTVHGEGTVGIASYTKNTLLHLLKILPDLNITVLAEKLDTDKEYVEDTIQVKRVWKRNNLFSLFGLFSQLFKAKERSILLSFEVYMFGSVFLAGLFLSLLPLLKFQKKKLFIILHQVPEDISDAEKGSLRAIFFPFLKHILYRLVTSGAHQVIVFEEALKKPLLPANNVLVIPHAVEPVTIISTDEARKKLGLSLNTTYILSFGFLSPYKGPDALLDIWENRDDIHLILGGGANPNHLENPSYKTYLDMVSQKAQDTKVTITGFISEIDLPLYFSAVDAVILPYRIFFSSSGPLSLAFAYEKPVVLSRALTPYFASPDFRKGLSQAQLDQEELLFGFDSDDLNRVLSHVQSKRKNYEIFSQYMKKERSWDHIAKAYAAVLRPHE